MGKEIETNGFGVGESVMRENEKWESGMEWSRPRPINTLPRVTVKHCLNRGNVFLEMLQNYQTKGMSNRHPFRQCRCSLVDDFQTTLRSVESRLSHRWSDNWVCGRTEIFICCKLAMMSFPNFLFLLFRNKSNCIDRNVRWNICNKIFRGKWSNLRI